MNDKEKMPSRIRYEKRNPVVSFRVKETWYIEFKKFLNHCSLSIGDFFRIAFKKQKANYKKARKKEYKDGYSEGYKVGYNKGYDTGKDDGFDDGYKKGYNEGCGEGSKKGYDEGCEDGYKKGFDEGSENGYKKGSQEGYEKGCKDDAENGEKIGYEKAWRKYCIWYYCVICDEAIVIESNSEEHNLIINISRHKMWGHSSCRQKYQRI